MKIMLPAGILVLATLALGANSLASGIGASPSAPHLLLARHSNGPKANRSRIWPAALPMSPGLGPFLNLLMALPTPCGVNRLSCCMAMSLICGINLGAEEVPSILKGMAESPRIPTADKTAPPVCRVARI